MPSVRDGRMLGLELCTFGLMTPARSLYIGSRLASASRIGLNLSVVSPSLLTHASPRIPTPCAFPAFWGWQTPLYSIVRSRIFRNTVMVGYALASERANSDHVTSAQASPHTVTMLNATPPSYLSSLTATHHFTSICRIFHFSASLLPHPKPPVLRSNGLNGATCTIYEFPRESSLSETIADRRKGLLWRVFSKRDCCLCVEEVMRCLS